VFFGERLLPREEPFASAQVRDAFEAARIAYLEALVEIYGIGPLVAGDIPGVRYVIVEATVRYKAPIYFEDALYCTASVRIVGNRSFTIDHELRADLSFETGRLVAEGFERLTQGICLGRLPGAVDTGEADDPPPPTRRHLRARLDLRPQRHRILGVDEVHPVRQRVAEERAKR
jgi:hypothetical protein